MNVAQLLENLVFERKTLVDEFLRQIIEWHSLDVGKRWVVVINDAVFTSDDEAAASGVTCAWSAVRQ